MGQPAGPQRSCGAGSERSEERHDAKHRLRAVPQAMQRLEKGGNLGKGGDGVVHPGGGGWGTGAAVVAGFHAVLQTTGNIRGEGVADDERFLRENGDGAIFVQLAEGVIEEGWGGLGGASMLRNEEIIKIRLHAANLQPVELLFVGAVAGDTQECAAGKALQELYGTGDWDGALMQGGTEVMFKGGAIKMDAKSGKNIVPADFLKLGEGEVYPPRSAARAYYFRR